MQLRHVAWLILWVFAVPGLAGEAVLGTSALGSWYAEDFPPSRQVADSPPITVGDSVLSYRNTHYNYYTPNAFFALQGQAFGDDIHMLMSGRLRTFRFIFGTPVPEPIRATVSFYANPDDACVGPLVAGPYEMGPFGGDSRRINFTVSDPPPVPQDLWFTIQYQSVYSGILLANGAFVGSSHDLFYNLTLQQTTQLSGQCTGPPVPLCVANMYLEVYLETDIMPIRATTWSGVKALFHVPPAAIPQPGFRTSTDLPPESMPRPASSP